MLQVHVPVEASQVPWPEQSSGQVRSYEWNSKLGKGIKAGIPKLIHGHSSKAVKERRNIQKNCFFMFLYYTNVTQCC